MKNRSISLLTALLILFSMGMLQAETGNDEKDTKKINWLTIEEAQKLGKTEPRKVFVDVYTDWCGWCKKMDASTFQDQAVVEYVNENYYAVKLDAESDTKIVFNNTTLTERELARAMRVQGYPTIVFLNETFTRITPVSGYRKADDFKKLLVDFNEQAVQ